MNDAELREKYGENVIINKVTPAEFDAMLEREEKRLAEQEKREVEEQIKGKAKWGMVQITIRKNRDIGFPVVGVVSSSFDEEHEWLLSENLAAELVKELESHLYQVGGEFSDFDLPIMEAVDMVSVAQQPGE
jgi:hypothetical protein